MGIGTALGGPDVVVSTVGEGLDTPGVAKYGSVNGITSYSITTTSCNIGTQTAIWTASTNQHPLIGSQVYRLHNGRFEQIGLSWLKHGFCAADWPSCTELVPGSIYQGNEECETLGRFATDTYYSGLNGQQSNIGPRSEVNANTGMYPFPPSMGWGSTYNCLVKRIQIANTDLSPVGYPGARYFGEAHYVTTDEARADRTNNASHRELIVGPLSSGTEDPSSVSPRCRSTNQGYALSFIGATTPLLPAINAWRNADPTVTLVNIDIANDGRVIVGAKVTSLGGNLWQYEYAVYNHNSDKAIGSFTLPKAGGAGVTITNLGFHDVAHHSGEPYDGTDWMSTVNANTVAWSTTAWSINPNANAIRWGTLYNFRLQSNRAPSNGSITLGLFKGTTPGSVIAGGLPVPSGAATCAADFNQVGGVTVQDIFDFLTAWFSGSIAADFNRDSGVTLQDVFDFLGAFFAGCL